MTGSAPSGPGRGQERPPQHVLAAARAAYRARRPDAVLADLVTDSAADPPSGTRPGPGRGPRLLAFGAAGLELHLQVTVHGDTCDIAGQLIPPARFTVELRLGDGSSHHVSDPGGAFTLHAVPRAPFSLVCSAPHSGFPALSIPWTAI